MKNLDRLVESYWSFQYVCIMSLVIRCTTYVSRILDMNQTKNLLLYLNNCEYFTTFLFVFKIIIRISFQRTIIIFIRYIRWLNISLDLSFLSFFIHSIFFLRFVVLAMAYKVCISDIIYASHQNSSFNLLKLKFGLNDTYASTKDVDLTAFSSMDRDLSMVVISCLILGFKDPIYFEVNELPQQFMCFVYGSFQSILFALESSTP